MDNLTCVNDTSTKIDVVVSIIYPPSHQFRVIMDPTQTRQLQTMAMQLITAERLETAATGVERAVTGVNDTVREGLVTLNRNLRENMESKGGQGADAVVRKRQRSSDESETEGDGEAQMQAQAQEAEKKAEAQYSLQYTIRQTVTDDFNCLEGAEEGQDQLLLLLLGFR
jgi:hypothetical protein